MSKRTSILLGLATFWPPLYILIFCGFILFTIVLFAPGASGTSEFPVGAFVVLTVLHVTTMVLSLILLVIYCIHLMKNDQLGNLRTPWLVFMLLGGIIAMPIYWYWYLRPHSSDAISAAV